MLYTYGYTLLLKDGLGRIILKSSTVIIFISVGKSAQYFIIRSMKKGSVINHQLYS